MVHITPETVERFKKMFKREYGVEYSDNEAWEATHNLLGTFDWLLKQNMKQNPQNYKKTNSEKQGGVKKPLFTDESIKALSELGDVLRRIHNRLISEGYEIKDGCISRGVNVQKKSDKIISE